MTEHSSNHKRLLRIAFTHRKPWILMALLSLGSAVTVLALMHGLSSGIDTVFQKRSSVTSARSILLVIGMAIAIRGVLFWIHEIFAQKVASELKASLRNQLFEKIQRLGPVWTESRNSGDLAASAVEGVEKLNAYFARFIPTAIHMMIAPVVIVVSVFFIDWLSGLILLLTGPLIPVFMSLIGARAQQQVQKQWASLRYLSSHFLDVVQGLRTLKLFHQTEQKRLEIETNSDRFRKSTLDVLTIAFLSGFILELFASLATALVAVEIGVRLVEGHIAFQMGLFVLLLAPEFYLPFRMFGAQHHAGMEGAESAGMIFRILDAGNHREKQSDESSGTVPEASKNHVLLPNIAKPCESGGGIVNETAPGNRGTLADLPISFHDVCFTYPGKRMPVLNHTTFTISKGERTALVGRTGSGKTTLLRLITRQLIPDTGSVCMYGMKSYTVPEKEWLARIAVVSQTSWFFDGTVMENIRAARPEATPEEVIRASASAGIHAFIQKLPDGYQTRTGECAARFSGGERQRISIARALLKDTPVLILDEPSSALDPETEQTIHRALENLMTGKTVLLIAHRLSTVRSADRILVLEGGRVISQGTHTALIQKCTTYRQMVTAYPEVRGQSS